MKLKLKEQPNEWRKFTLVWCAFIPVAMFLLARKGTVPWMAFKAALALGLAAASLALVKPAFFRGFYRAGMTCSFYVGQFMGKVILTVIFWIAVVPMSLLMRVLGKDLLEVKRVRERASYWKEARKTGTFEQQF